MVTVRIDEARRQHQPRRDHLSLALSDCQVTDLQNAIASHAHVADATRCAGAVDHPRVREKQIAGLSVKCRSAPHRAAGISWAAVVDSLLAS